MYGPKVLEKYKLNEQSMSDMFGYIMINNNNKCCALFFDSIEALNPENTYYHKFAGYERTSRATFERTDELFITSINKFASHLLEVALGKLDNFT